MARSLRPPLAVWLLVYHPPAMQGGAAGTDLGQGQEGAVGHESCSTAGRTERKGGHGDFSAARDMVHPAKAYYPGKSGCRDFLFRLIGRRRRRAEH